eukprot:CAMPEP_0172515864 /NCGR_PEP_ID=MMETSP1066-20121228/271515_1 /TAXON_ID=671091 /ORGANISM="Coscinodiscus wailesii, Strain CCMP2513" /LENGTH=373 /DNA_ID=CAMNT_0013297091 /DNA_START=56 /DNA_END=1177 /DNA_ORIENTATION=-
MHPSSDILEPIIQHLSQKYQLPPKSIISPKTHELIRIIKSKQRNPLCPFDTAQIRAGVCLEFILRNCHDTKISHDVLAQSVATTKQKFLVIFNGLSHLLKEASIKRTKKKNDNGENGSIIDTLSLKLASYVQDMDQTITKTDELLKRTYRAMETSGLDKSALLDDFRRKKDTYAAVCFYLIALKGNDGDMKLPKHKTVDAAKLNLKEFDGVLVQVQRLERKYALKKRDMEKKEESRKVERQNGRKNKRKRDSVDSSSTKRNIKARVSNDDIDDDDESISNSATQTSQDDNVEESLDLSYVSTKKKLVSKSRRLMPKDLILPLPLSNKFQEWMEDTLKKAARKVSDDAIENVDLTERQLKSKAAESVLREHGLL